MRLVSFFSPDSWFVPLLNDTEQITVRILQHHIVCSLRITPRVASSTQADQSFHFVILPAGIEVEVKPAPVSSAPVACLERKIRSSSLRIAKNHPVIARRFTRNVAQSLLPECDHLLEFEAMYHD
ncbi:hypothetical protein OPIT5_30645 [Opitutaceae bacterium TAV5]|nr:hypothetical protein OPIT5_30645 [Opitutaceae bacterium TAV5]